jgi:hypothetical protein
MSVKSDKHKTFFSIESCYYMFILPGKKDEDYDYDNQNISVVVWHKYFVPVCGKKENIKAMH